MAILSVTRYWFEFSASTNKLPLELKFGVGVTAYSYNDAIFLLRKYFFKNGDMPEIDRLTENIDLSILDVNHILPNIIVSPSIRGIWFPQGFKL